MEKPKQCLYCLKLRLKSIPVDILNCSCEICQNCLNYLISSKFFACPLCNADFKKTQSENSIFNQIDLKSKGNNFSISRVSNHLKNLLRSYKDKKNKYKTLISLRKTEEITTFSPTFTENQIKASTLLEFIKEMKLFQYIQKYHKIQFSVYDKCCSQELYEISSLVLKRETSKIQDSEKCIFLGDNFTYYLFLGEAMSLHRFKIISGKPTCVIELGIANSAGVDSSIFITSLEIMEDDRVIYVDFPEILINNNDSRLTFGLKLSNPIWLYEGRTYQFRYHVLVKYCYAVRYLKEFYDTSGLKIQHFDMKNVAFLTFYLRVRD